MFHEDELKDVRSGKAICVECGFEREFNMFLGEVLAGEHKELIAELQERLVETEE
jgi:hypothetical protein